jgi:hypothetical protein
LREIGGFCAEVWKVEGFQRKGEAKSSKQGSSDVE